MPLLRDDERFARVPGALRTAVRFVVLVLVRDAVRVFAFAMCGGPLIWRGGRLQDNTQGSCTFHAIDHKASEDTQVQKLVPLVETGVIVQALSAGLTPRTPPPPARHGSRFAIVAAVGHERAGHGCISR